MSLFIATFTKNIRVDTLILLTRYALHEEGEFVVAPDVVCFQLADRQLVDTLGYPVPELSPLHTELCTLGVSILVAEWHGSRSWTRPLEVLVGVVYKVHLGSNAINRAASASFLWVSSCGPLY